MENSYFHNDIILQKSIELKMSVIVLLSLIHFPPFFSLWIFIYKSKTTIFSIQREIIKKPPFSEN